MHKRCGGVYPEDGDRTFHRNLGAYIYQSTQHYNPVAASQHSTAVRTPNLKTKNITNFKT